MDKERLNEIRAVLLLAAALLIFLSLVSYDPYDLSFYTSSPSLTKANFVGVFGAYLAGMLLLFIGWSAYIIPALFAFWGIGKFCWTAPQKFYLRLLGSVILFSSSSALLSLIAIGEPLARFQRGGMCGLLISDLLIEYFGMIGAYIIIVTLLTLSLLLATQFLIVPFVLEMKKGISFVIARQRNLREETSLNRKAKRKEAQNSARVRVESDRVSAVALAPDAGAAGAEAKLRGSGGSEKRISIANIKLPGAKKEPLSAKAASNEPRPKRSAGFSKTASGDYKLPNLDLLDSPPPFADRKIQDDLESNSAVLEGTLRDFGIEARVVQVDRGPVITRYEIQPAAGIKVHKITELSDDIALAMKATSVRIVAPIPGKDRVGVEAPNSTTTLVYLKEILESRAFQDSDSLLTLALGKDISGTPVIANLSDMPHLLIAGATGSGKTVCVNSLIISILFNASPDEVKFLMIDPKMVELAVFNDLPHLLCPVVTDAAKVSSALAWVVNEMEERYKLLAKAGARNMDAYNEKIVADCPLAAGESEEEDAEARLPYIVVIIDELADLMAVASADIETAITRLAQLSRAVGIHIILATQRPSVDVITGLIKANFPARISFRVASKVDSRTVLDANGADKLLGKGDMLFLKPGASKFIRAQGTLISDKEIEKVARFIKSQKEPVYNEEILKGEEKRKLFGSFDNDELFDDAVKVILESGLASVSMLQRRLRISHTRAGRLIDAMEVKGIVGPYKGSRPREILIDREEKGSGLEF